MAKVYVELDLDTDGKVDTFELATNLSCLFSDAAGKYGLPLVLDLTVWSSLFDLNYDITMLADELRGEQALLSHQIEGDKPC